MSVPARLSIFFRISKKKNMSTRKKRRQRPLPLLPDELRLVFEDKDCPTRPEEFETPAQNGERGVLTSAAVLRYIANHQGVNSPGLARFFTKTLKTIARFTTELRFRDFIEFRGSLNKGGYFLKPAGLQFLEHPEQAEEFSPVRMTSALVLEFIRTHPGANHYAIAAEFKRTIKSVARHTQRLRGKKLVVYRGTPRDGGFYAR